MNKLQTDFLPLLQALAQLNEQPCSPDSTLSKALGLIAQGLCIKRGAISIIDPFDGKIRIRAAHGLKEAQIRRGEYRPGEGITGNVVASGKPIHIGDISKEPLFLNRTGAHKPETEKISFICAPIMAVGKVLGAIWIDQTLKDGNRGDAQLEFLRIIASMLGPIALESQTLHSEMLEKPKQFGRFIGNCANIQKIYAQIVQVAPSAMTVLLEGESGTGKELAALAIHEAGNRSAGPFISLNCAALPEQLVESEMFGHERGAFTGAAQTRKGKFELADHGTLFLDEIGDMSLAMQAKLLRVLQDHCFERVGGTRPIKADVRVVAATNRNLAEMVQDGTFRRDLFYRLNVFPIHMPPLRERREDIPALAKYFTEEQAKANETKPPAISPAAMELLCNYPWPGNIRELKNALERACLLSGGNPILPEHLPDILRKEKRGKFKSQEILDLPKLADQLQEIERKAVTDALQESGGHIGKAARMLGLTTRIFSLRLAKYGINYRQYRKNGKFRAITK